MNADTIARRIVEDARKAAQEAVDAANARAEEARKAAAAEVEKKREAALARADEDAARQRENALRMAELDQRKALLAMKREMIDSAFAQALEALIAMPVEQARAVNMRLLLDAAEGEMELVVAQADEAIFSAEFLAEANRNLAARARGCALPHSASPRAAVSSCAGAAWRFPANTRRSSRRFARCGKRTWRRCCSNK